MSFDFRMKLLLSASVAGTLSLGAVSTIGMSRSFVRGDEDEVLCAGIEFGALFHSTSSTVSGDLASYFTVPSYEDAKTRLGNLSIAAGSRVYAKKGGGSYDQNYALKLGTNSTTGSITVSFDSASISSITVYGCLSSTNSKATDGSFQVTTSSSISQSGSFSTRPSSTSVAELTTEAVTLTGFSGTCTNFTLESTNASYGAIFISKIVCRLSGKGGASESSVEDPTAPISFHFLELGNAETGDSTYIKAGDLDILIDAGSNYNSYASISSAIDQYCTDGKLEFVIATHAHMDHISGFVHNYATSSDTSGDGIFYHYSIGTIIDFAQTKATSKVYSYYQYGRDYAVSQGAAHYTAKECYDSDSKGVEGDGSAHRIYELGKNLTMEILHTKYYDEVGDDENNHSVCVLFRQGDSSFLFTGDLEMDGIASLLEGNDLPKVRLYKGGHHGSYTAASKALYDTIEPEKVAVCCCGGNQQYTSGAEHVFPTQDFIDCAAPYTKDIYFTTLGSFTDVSSHSSFNGQINLSYDSSSNVSVDCSESGTVLPESDWFNRTDDLWTSTLTQVKTTKSAAAKLSVGTTVDVKRDPSDSSTWSNEGTSVLTSYTIHKTVTSIEENSSSTTYPYLVSYSLTYDYIDSSGTSVLGASTMPNRLWPTSGVALS